MVDTLRIKRRDSSGAAGAPTSLAAAEIAYNEKDDTLYYGRGNSGGLAVTIIPIAGPGTFATILSPTFTGDPKAPTPATSDNDTSIATTAFVKAQAYLTANQTITHTGDATGSGTTSIPMTVVALQGRSMLSTAPTTGQTITWSGSAWAPATPAAAPPAGTTGQVQYNNSGVLGAYPITGTGNAVLSANPTLTGSVPINGGALGTTAGNTINVFSPNSTTTNGDALRHEIQRASAGTDWSTAKWQIYRQVDSTKMGYFELGNQGIKPIAFGLNVTEYANFSNTGVANFNFALTAKTTITVSSAAGAWSSIFLNGPGATFGNQIMGQIGGKNRWSILPGNGTTESGSNVGSDFNIARYDDTGALLDNPLTIARSTGVAAFNHDLYIAGSIYQNAPTANWATLSLNTPATPAGCVIYGNMNAKSRWAILLCNGAAESGSNAGSDFNISRYTDAGILIDSPVGILRSTGAIYLNNNTYLGANGQATGFFDAIQAFKCRAGAGGAASGNTFAYDWATPGQMDMWVGTTRIGYISTVSDYRVKKEVQPLYSTWGYVKALNPIRYNRKEFQPPNVKMNEDGSMPPPLFTEDNQERWGFIAHELQETLIADAATGVKDGEVVQSPNPWTIIAALTKALQEAMERIETLEAKVGA
jgi:hypothetical protein